MTQASNVRLVTEATVAQLARTAVGATGTNTGDQSLSIAGTSLTISGTNGNTITLPVGTGGTAPDATTTTKGSIQLAGDLAGTAAAPTVPGLATKFTAMVVTATKTSAYTAGANEIVPVDATSAPVTITLPTTPADKSRISIKKVDSGANIVTIASGGSATLNSASGPTSGSLSLPNQALTIQYVSGTNIWLVISSDLPLGQIDGRYAPIGPRTQVIIYTAGAYPARPLAATCPAGWAIYKGPVAPTDSLANDEWVNNS